MWMTGSDHPLLIHTRQMGTPYWVRCAAGWLPHGVESKRRHHGIFLKATKYDVHYLQYVQGIFSFVTPSTHSLMLLQA